MWHRADQLDRRPKGWLAFTIRRLDGAVDLRAPFAPVPRRPLNSIGAHTPRCCCSATRKKFERQLSGSAADSTAMEIGGGATAAEIGAGMTGVAADAAAISAQLDAEEWRGLVGAYLDAASAAWAAILPII